jgi:hypothetical protein
MPDIEKEENPEAEKAAAAEAEKAAAAAAAAEAKKAAEAAEAKKAAAAKVPETPPTSLLLNAILTTLNGIFSSSPPNPAYDELKRIIDARAAAVIKPS